MSFIRLTDEPFAACKKLGDAVEVRSPDGSVLGHIYPLPPYVTPEFVAGAVRRAKTPGPSLPADQVLARFGELVAEKERGRTFDRAFVRWFLKQPDGSALGDAERRESA